MAKKNVAVGIDIGGTNTALGIVESNGEYLIGDTILTYADEDIEKFIFRISEKIKELYKQYEDQYNMVGIGVAAPNANYYTGIIETPSNLKWRNTNFVEIMQDLLHLPVVTINDASAAAFGELKFGKAKGFKNFIEVTIGTGLGSGIIVDGNMLLGVNGYAGEIGHTIIEPNGRMCNCGRRGCLETYASASGICRTAFHLLSQHNDYTKLREIPFNQLSSKKIYDLALNGDKIAIQAFTITGEILGKALANAVLYYSPEAIILFGGLADAGELLIKPTRRSFEENLLNVYKRKIEILQSGLQGGKAAVLGASSLILSEINNKKSMELNSQVP